MHECGGKWFPLFDIYILRFKAVIVQPGIFLSYSSFNFFILNTANQDVYALSQISISILCLPITFKRLKHLRVEFKK